MAKPIDDTELLVTLAEDIVSGRAETATGAMRLHGVARKSGQERRLLRKWAACGPVALAAVRRAEAMREDARFRKPAPMRPSLLSRLFGRRERVWES